MFSRARFIRFITCVTLLLLFASLPGSALAQQGTPPAPTTETSVMWFVSDINDVGDVVGGMTINEFPAVEGTPEPFLGTQRFVAMLWREGQATELGSLPGSQGAMSEGFNNRGQIVGTAMFPDGETRAVLWDGGEVIDLGSLPGYSSSGAVDVNDAGQIIGSSGNMGELHATLWEDGVPAALGELPGHTMSYASAINDDRQVVGLSAESPEPSGVMRAVLWDGGAPVDLGTLPDDSSSHAMDISNNGVVVGWSGTRGGKQSHGVFWENGEIAALTSTAGDLRSADAVNERGDIVGATGDQFAGESTALLLRNGK
jgi:probable HAF family extracellular repeat protein